MSASFFRPLPSTNTSLFRLPLLFLLFLQYLLACVFMLHETFWLLLRFLRTSRGPSLPYKLPVFSFAKLVILVIPAIFASQLLPNFLVNHLLLKLRLKFASKILLQPAILDISLDTNAKQLNFTKKLKTASRT